MPAPAPRDRASPRVPHRRRQAPHSRFGAGRRRRLFHAHSSRTRGRRTPWCTSPCCTYRRTRRRSPLRDDPEGALICCALGRIRTCNLLIRSQMLYPLSYECLASRRFFLPVGVAWTTLHDLRPDTKSITPTLPDLRKRPSSRRQRHRSQCPAGATTKVRGGTPGPVGGARRPGRAGGMKTPRPRPEGTGSRSARSGGSGI